MKIALHKFKKISETKKSAVLQHPAGHKITIAKHVLSPEMSHELSKLPMHLAEGGPVQLTDDLDEMDKLKEEAKAAPRGMGKAEEYARAKTDFQPTFPEATPIAEAINPAPEAPITQAPVAAQPVGTQPGGAPDFFTNGTFDFNKFALQTPGVPAWRKMQAMEQTTKEEENKAARESHDKELALKDQQSQYEAAIKYNAMAQKRGLSPIPVPDAPAPTMAPEITAPKAPAPQPAGMAAAPQAPQDPYGTDAYQKTFERGLGKAEQDGLPGSGVIGGTEAAAKAEGALGTEQAGIYKNAFADEQAIIKHHTDQVNALNTERDNFIHDYQNKQIDPNRVFKNMSVGQKISTSIGLILGGMGGGGHGNMALDFLNKQISNDIEAQRADMGKSENLLTANFKQFGNVKDATEMTRVMQGDIVKNQIAQAAAKSQDPIVKARAQAAIGQIEMQNASVLSQIAIRKNLSDPNMDPSSKIRLLSITGMIHSGEEEPVYKELAEAQDMTRAKDNLLGSFDQVAKINTIGNRLTSPLQSVKQTNAIIDPLIAQLSKATAGRFTEADSHFIRTLFPAPGDDAKTQQIKLNQLNKIISEKMNFPRLKSYGINLGNAPGSGRFDASGQKKLQMGAPVANNGK